MPAKPVRLLLVNPMPPDSFWSFRWAMDRIMSRARALNPPLGLATLAGLCPEHWEVTIADEAVEPLPVEPEADLVGVCGMGVQHERQRQLMAAYRDRGYFTVVGGSFASLCPDRFEGIADSVVAGEAERIWPQFCRDWEVGLVEPLYQEQEAVELTEVPVPRFDLLDLSRYATASLQFSRGCPYRCDFCDIIVMYGRRPRTKPPEQIGRQLDALRAQGADSAFFVDDNLIGNKKVAKELLRYLADYQQRHGYPFEFGTEASLNLAGDPELLELFRDAGFGWVFLGIETPDVESLKASGKTQNTKTDLLGSVRTLYRYGIDVFAGFIVGFDNDTPETFERQHRFIVDAGIQVAMVGLLTALPHTPLYHRLEGEGRLRRDVAPGDNTGGQTNVLPAGMSYEAMIEGYKGLYRWLFSDADIARRIRNKHRYFRRPNAAGTCDPVREQFRMLGRLLWRGILPGGPRRWGWFLATLACPPRLWPHVVTDWVRGLSMRDYVRRHFEEASPRAWVRASRALASIKRRCEPAFRRGALSAEMAAYQEAPRLTITLCGAVESSFFGPARRRLERWLRQPRASLTLYISSVYQWQREPLLRFLRRLSRYRGKVTIYLTETARHQLGVELQRWNILFELWAAET